MPVPYRPGAMGGLQAAAWDVQETFSAARNVRETPSLYRYILQ